MRADSEPDAVGPDGCKIGGGQVLLAKVEVIGTEFDRLAPVVVDDQLAAMLRAYLQAFGDLVADALGRRIFEAQLMVRTPSGTRRFSQARSGAMG
jgi:hypothetical protein